MPEIMRPSKLFHETVGRQIAKFREGIAAQKLKELKTGDYLPIEIPVYISQLADAQPDKIKQVYDDITDTQAAARFGAKDPDEFSYWSWRSCGIVGVQMVLKTIKKDAFKKDTMELVKEGLKYGGYNIDTDTGWYHNSLVKLALAHGVLGYTRKFIPSSEIALLLNDKNYVLASIDSPRGGHLILLYGFRINTEGKLEGFWYHNPNNYQKSGEAQFITKKSFEKMSTRRVIAFGIL